MASDVHLRILSGGAAKGLVDALSPSFLARHGVAIDGTFGAVGAMRDRLRAGIPADVAILTKALIGELQAAGDVIAGTAADIGSVATAVATRRGDPLPLIGKPDLFKAALAEASEIFFPDPDLATAGIHVAGVLRALGLDRDAASRLRTFPNGATAMQALAAATTAQPIGMTQVSEILSTPGVTLVAPLPDPYGLATVYTAAVTSRAAHPDAARRLVAMLTAPDAAAARSAAGFAAIGAP